MSKNIFLSLLIIISFTNCQSKTNPLQPSVPTEKLDVDIASILYDTTIRTAHIFVALCDNKYQGIVPVPPKIGNGQDPDNNLYWGAMYGVKTYFKNSKDWNLVSSKKSENEILERLVFKHKIQNFYIIADAYDGKYIKKTTIDFLNSSTGQDKDTMHVAGKIIGIKGNSRLISYIGHNGLMDFNLADDFKNQDKKLRDIIILACYSQHYFSPLLKDGNVNPLVWSSHLMAPEAYILHDAISGYLSNESNHQIQKRAAAAYSKFQKCSLNAANKLLVTGW